MAKPCKSRLARPGLDELMQDDLHAENQRSHRHVPEKRLQYLVTRVVPFVADIVVVAEIISEQADVPFVGGEPERRKPCFEDARSRGLTAARQANH